VKEEKKSEKREILRKQNRRESSVQREEKVI
jgi:hypothetical protein